MQNKQFRVIIPARIGSTRLANKMLAEIDGVPLIIRTANQAQKSHACSVVVATDNNKIEDVCKLYGITTILTDSTHSTGTDRIAQAS